MAEMRVSPDGRNVAIRNRDSQSNPWRVSNGGYYHDSLVADWPPLVAETEVNERVAIELDEQVTYWRSEVEWRETLHRRLEDQHAESSTLETVRAGIDVCQLAANRAFARAAQLRGGAHSGE